MKDFFLEWVVGLVAGGEGGKKNIFFLRGGGFFIWGGD
jgi:hypothetical protein